MTKRNNEISSFLKFLNDSPTAWHAVANAADTLIQKGYEPLEEQEQWRLKPGGSYFVVRNGSSLCAFTLPKNAPASILVAAAHTDSPSFKIKPNAAFSKENMIMLGVEVYGAPLLASWLNRDLGIAGRVIFQDAKGKTREQLIHLDNHPVVIPQLAIHLDREVNEKGLVLNKQEHLAAIAGIANKKSAEHYLESILKAQLPLKHLLAFDLFLYPLEKARCLGEHNELIASYRIDNLAGTYTVLHGMTSSKHHHKDQIKMAILWDNEEIGSTTAQGAGSPFLLHVIERISLALGTQRETYLQWFSNSLCASVDLGHAYHPGYSDKHEPRHPALLNKGILIKSNAQNRYASDARSAASIVALCRKNKIPFQKYVSRGDIPCGSTVGPIHANRTGMPTVDIGISQLSMHSCRELMGTEDFHSLCSLLEALFI